MLFINGYKYQIESQVIEAQLSCDKYYGVPKEASDITQHWANYEFAEFNTPQFWYIVFDESLTPILGTPIEFEVAPPPFPPAE